MARIMLLGASDIQLPSILKAKEAGHWTIVVDFNPKAPGLACADVPLVISTNDIQAVLEASRKERIDGILTTSDFPVRTVAAVGRALGLPVLSEEAARICTDKYLQRNLLQSAGLRMPEFRQIEPGETVSAGLGFSFPVIVKPVDSSASRGVRRVDQPEDLKAAITFARSFSHSGVVLVEEFVYGREFSIEALVQNRTMHLVAITEKTTTGECGQYFVEERHVIPADVTPQETSAIRIVTEASIKAAGLDHCAVHAEVILTETGPVLIEMAARLGGDYITSDLVPLATGVDMIGNVIRMALGQRLELLTGASLFAGVQFVTPQNFSRASDYFRRASGNPNIIRCSIADSCPQRRVMKSSMDRLGYIIAQAESREKLLDILAL